MDFLLTSGQRGIFDDEAAALGAKLHYIPFGKKTLPRFIRDFRSLLREESYDAIHHHQDYVSGWHFLVGTALLPRVAVTHVHNPSYQIINNYGVSLRRRVTSKIGRTLVKRYTTHVAGTSRQLISEYGFDEGPLGKLPKAALYCGFDPARFAGDSHGARQSLLTELDWPSDSRVVLFAGRIDQSPDPDHPQAHKNSGFAVDVAIAAAKNDPKIRMILAGNPSDATPELEARIASAGLAGRIRFLGVRRDIESLMMASDLLFFPSRGEGLGMVAVEAQAAGLPVLMSTAVPGESVVIPELVTRKDLKEGAAAWARTLADLLAAEKPVSAAEANRRVDASPFSLRNSAGNLYQLYTKGLLPEATKTIA
jgi:glycosyltransferase involved in cell wall biosynthesis